MKRLSLGAFGIFVVIVTGSVFSQTSPWPFANRSPASQPISASPAGTVTVAFWNIQWFPGGRPSPTKAEEAKQIASVHADIAKLNADVIGFEEVRDFTQAGIAVQPLPGFKVDVCGNFPPREGQTEAQEVAIASRLNALSAWSEEWKANDAIVPPRGFAFAAYEVAPRQLLLVYGLHLKSNRGDLNENVALRQESMRQLVSHMGAMETAYGKLGTISWIVGGDCNTSLDDPQYSRETTLRSLMNNGFGWIWQGTPLGSRITMPPDKGFAATCFDHIFYKGAKLRKASAMMTSPQSSDHRAVVATFDLPAAQ